MFVFLMEINMSGCLMDDKHSCNKTIHTTFIAHTDSSNHVKQQFALQD